MEDKLGVYLRENRDHQLESLKECLRIPSISTLVVMMGFGLPDSRVHATDERFSLVIGSFRGGFLEI